jgi:MFS family permease
LFSSSKVTKPSYASSPRVLAYDMVRGQAAFAELHVAKQFHVSKEVAILGVSLFVLGLGLGPLVAGPMSESYGRNAVYRLSFCLFFACMFPVAFAPDICTCVMCYPSLLFCVNSLVFCDNAMPVDSCVPDLPLHLRVLRRCISQRGWGKRE